MSSFLQNLKEYSKSPLSVYHKFRTLTRSDDTLYLFVEGYDDKSYYSALCEAKGLKARVFITFGKNNLDTIYFEHSASSKKSKNVKFIRDRDFDQFLGKVKSSEDFFVTCAYSVENYVFTEAAIAKLLEARYGLDPSEVDIFEDIGKFSEALEALNNWLVPLYAKAFECSLSNHKVDLNKVNIDTYAKAVLKKKNLPSEFPFSELGLEDYLNTPPPPELVASASTYIGESHHKTIRGKYLATLSAEFLKLTLEKYIQLHKSGAIAHLNRSACGSISVEAIFTAMIPYAKASDRLYEALSLDEAA